MKVLLAELFGLTWPQLEQIISNLEIAQTSERKRLIRVLAIHGDSTLRALVAASFAERTDLTPLELTERLTRLVKNKSLATYLAIKTHLADVTHDEHHRLIRLLGRTSEHVVTLSQDTLGTAFELFVELLRRVGAVDALHRVVAAYIEEVETRVDLFGAIPVHFGKRRLPTGAVHTAPFSHAFAVAASAAADASADTEDEDLCRISEESFQVDLRVALALSRIDEYYVPRHELSVPIYIDLTVDED